MIGSRLLLVLSTHQWDGYVYSQVLLPGHLNILMTTLVKPNPSTLPYAHGYVCWLHGWGCVCVCCSRAALIYVRVWWGRVSARAGRGLLLPPHDGECRLNSVGPIKKTLASGCVAGWLLSTHEKTHLCIMYMLVISFHKLSFQGIDIDVLLPETPAEGLWSLYTLYQWYRCGFLRTKLEWTWPKDISLDSFRLVPSFIILVVSWCESPFSLSPS